MAQRKVVWTKTAALQRRKILQYWSKHNKSNAFSLRLLKISNNKTKSIARYPEMYKLSEYPNTRVASLGHFSIYYQIETEHIIITAFWDNRQSPKKLLQQLQKEK